MSVRTKIIDALVKKYNAEIAENLAIIEVYLENPVGIGEHSGIVSEIDGLLEAVSCAHDKLSVVANIRENEKKDE